MSLNKYIASFILVMLCSNLAAQKFTEKRLKKLEKLGIEYKPEYAAVEEINNDLYQIIKSHSKRRRSRIIGAALFSVGVSGIVTGAKINSYDAGPFNSIGAGFCYAVGAAGAGASIPLFVRSHKHKKKRNKLKKLYQNN